MGTSHSRSPDRLRVGVGRIAVNHVARLGRFHDLFEIGQPKIGVANAMVPDVHPLAE